MKLIEKCEEKLKDKFGYIDEIALFNQVKGFNAFKEHKVATRHFNGTTGYGYDDEGRDTLGKLYAHAFGADAGIVSPHLLSGTHALTVALFGLLRPKDTLFCISGMPYDTIRGVIFGENNGSLKDFGVNFEYCDLVGGKPCFEEIERKYKVTNNVKVVYIQRSRGYELRDAFSCEEIGEMCAFIRKIGFKGCIFVDNCYGEFVEKQEPTEVGADIIVGSLIKNAGGGLAPTGGYICGKSEFIDLIGKRLTAPSIGLEVGSYDGSYRNFYQGLFLAPSVTANALKSAVFAANIYEDLGFPVAPDGKESRHDIIQAVTFGKPEGVIAFCEGIQQAAPVDGYVTPEPWDMPGYDSPVIMAAGAFVSGSSIELSADGPIKPPYAVYFQGGLTWQHGKFGIMKTLQKLVEKGIVSADFTSFS